MPLDLACADDLDRLSRRLGYRFQDPSLFELALSHRSVSRRRNNERLEFLGDAVLQLVISAELFRKFPTRDEGALSKARARLVNKEALAEQALAVEIGPELVVSRGEEKSGGRERPSALADASRLWWARFISMADSRK